MKQSKKYSFNIEQEDKVWTTFISRRVTSRTTVVSKKQSGFETEAEARTWGESQVEAFLKKTNLGEQEKRKAKKKLEEENLSKKKEEMHKQD